MVIFNQSSSSIKYSLYTIGVFIYSYIFCFKYICPILINDEYHVNILEIWNIYFNYKTTIIFNI